MLHARPYHVVIAQAARLQALEREIYDGAAFPSRPGQRPLSKAVTHLLDRYIEELSSKEADREAVLKTLGTLILIDLLRSCRDKGLPQRRSSARYPGIRKALHAIRDNFDVDLPLAELAGIAGLSVHRFIVVFRDQVGSTPHAYLKMMRLRWAAEHLRAGGFITDVCYKVGFGSLSGFEQAFRKRYGVTP